jgi:hypothetical protein
MAQRAETLNVEAGELDPVQPLNENVAEIRPASSGNYEIEGWAGAAYSKAAERYHIFAAQVRRNFRVIRNERPLLIVAAAAGVALISGVLLRAWRSRHYE